MKPLKNPIQHGSITPAGTEWLCGTGYTHSATALTAGKFGRMFPNLSSTVFHPHFLHEVGKNNGPMDGGPNANPLSKDVPSGFTFVGQFIDHDITFDTTSSLDRANDPRLISNGRTPALELDSIYGMGRERSPYLYEPGTAKLLLGGAMVNDTPDGNDLPRNSANSALIGDPRNDENFFIGHLQLAFLHFHNAVVEDIAPQFADNHQLFEEAQGLVRWHYQWMVLNEYLPLIVGREMVDTIMREGLRYYLPQTLGGHKPTTLHPFIPIEFSVAAFRFGHSQVNRDLKDANGVVRGFFPDVDAPNKPIFNAGFQPLTAKDKDGNDVPIDWTQLFAVNGSTPEMAARIDTKLAPSLMSLPHSVVGGDAGGQRASLATRNLLRGNSFALPSGETLARHMGVDVLNAADTGLVSLFQDFNMPTHNGETQTPLWYYILCEAEVMNKGETLGPVGGRIVGEVLMGLLLFDPMSYINVNPNWVPTYGQNGQFTMADLLTTAKMI